MAKRRKTFKKEFRVDVYDKMGGYCAYCGDHLHINKFQIDHIIPWDLFDKHVVHRIHIPIFLEHLTIDDVHHIDNLFPTCAVCNNFKDTFHLELFRNELNKQLERANRYSTNYRFAKRYNQVKETPQPIIFYFEKYRPNTEGEE